MTTSRLAALPTKERHYVGIDASGVPPQIR